MNYDRTAFMYLKEKFGLFISEAKLKREVFISPEIRKLLLDNQFTEELNSTNLDAWKPFNMLSTIFSENIKLKIL